MVTDLNPWTSEKPRLNPNLLWMSVGIVAFLLLQIPLSGYLIDDTYIHLTFARNIAGGAGFSFNPGEPTYGVSAPLYTLLLTLLSLLFGANPIVAKITSMAFGILTIPLIYRLARRIGLSAPSIIGVTIAWSVNLWLVRWSASGMESSLAVLLLILAFDAQLQGRGVAGVWLGLATLTRMETAALIPIFALDRWLTHDLKRALGTIVLFLLVVLPWQLYAWMTFTTLLPNPAQVKSDVALPSLSDVWMGIKRTGGIVLASSTWEIVVVVLAIAILWFWRKRLTFIAGNGSLVSLFPEPPAPVSRARCISFLVVWVIFPPLIYLTRGIFVQSRYLLIAIPALLIGGFLAFDSLERRRISFFNQTTRLVFVALIIAQNILLSFVITYPHTRAFRQTTDALTELAFFLKHNTPPGSSVAVGDVGLVGFYSHRYVIDVEGLVTHQMIPIRSLMPQEDLIASELYWTVKQPDYVIDNSTNPLRLCQLPEVAAHYRQIKHIPITSAMIGRDKEQRFYSLYQVVEENSPAKVRAKSAK
jgi:hypothetical protein